MDNKGDKEIVNACAKSFSSNYDFERRGRRGPLLHKRRFFRFRKLGIEDLDGKIRIKEIVKSINFLNSRAKDNSFGLWRIKSGLKEGKDFGFDRVVKGGGDIDDRVFEVGPGSGHSNYLKERTKPGLESGLERGWNSGREEEERN